MINIFESQYILYKQYYLIVQPVHLSSSPSPVILISGAVPVPLLLAPPGSDRGHGLKLTGDGPCRPEADGAVCPQ